MDRLVRTVETRFTSETSSMERGSKSVQEKMDAAKKSVTYVNMEVTKGKAAADAWAASMVTGAEKSRQKTESLATSTRGALSSIRQHWLAYTVAVYGASRALEAAVGPSMRWEEAQESMRLMARGSAQELAYMRSQVERLSGGIFKKSEIANAYAMGQAIGWTRKQLDEIFPLLMRMANEANKPLEEVMRAFASATETGSDKTIAFMGVQLREEQLQKISIETYKKKFAVLTDVEQAQVRFQSVMEQLTVLVGSEQEAIGKLGAATKKLGADWENLLISPAMTDGFARIVDFADSAVMALTKLSDWEERHPDLFAFLTGTPLRAKKAPVAPDVTLAGLGYEPSALEKLLTDMSVEAGEEGGKSAYDTWRDAFLAEMAKDEETARNLARYFNERFPRALREEFDVRMAPEVAGPPAPDKGIKAIEFNVTESTPEILAMRHAAAMEQEILTQRAQAWEAWGEHVEGTYGAAMDTMSVVAGKFLNREVDSQKKLVAIWRWAGKHSLAAFMDYMAQKAKMRALEEAAEALAAKFGFLTGPLAAGGHAAAAVKFGLISAAAGGAASALEAGAQRELAAFNQQSIAGSSRADRITGTASSNSTGSVTGRIERGPDVVYYTFHTYFQGTNIVGPDETAVDTLWRRYLLPRVQRALETKEITV